MTEFKAGDKVYVYGPALGMVFFDPSVVREVFLHEGAKNLCVYDDVELEEIKKGYEFQPGWDIDGSVIKPIIRHV